MSSVLVPLEGSSGFKLDSTILTGVRVSVHVETFNVSCQGTLVIEHLLANPTDPELGSGWIWMTNNLALYVGQHPALLDIH